MSFLYPRKITVLRAITASNINDHSYEGRTQSEFTTIASNLIASIQLSSQSSRPTTQLPADASNDTYWRIFQPTLAAGTIQVRDVIVDDLGRRFEVVGDYWNSLGYNILAKRLTT